MMEKKHCKRPDENSWHKLIICALFIGYFGFIIWLTVLSRFVKTRRIELRPFRALQEIICGNPKGWEEVVWYFQNILLFIPFGFLLRGIVDNWKKVVLFGVIVSCGIEIIQYISATGLAEIDDVTANAIGTGMGCLLWKAGKKMNMRLKKRET